MVAEKIIFLQMHNTILQSEKYFLNVQMINLEKNKLESAPPPPPPSFKKTCPCTMLAPPFFNFPYPATHLWGGNQNLLPLL